MIIILGFKATGVSGLALVAPMTAQTLVEQGDSVLRDGKEIIIDDPADYTYQANDMLLSVRLQHLGWVAIAVGRRIFAFLQDHKMTLDNAASFGIFNSYLDSAADLIRGYRP